MKLQEYIEAHKKINPDFRKTWPHMKVGTAIEIARVNRGYTQKELANACGMKQTAIARMENGSHATIESLRRIAEALDMELSVTFLSKPKSL